MLILSLIILCAGAMLTHELGHLLAARHFKVRASELGLGLGPQIVRVKLGTVHLSLRAIPLGSFVRLDATALRSLPVMKQLAVHLAGIAFNLTAGLLAYGTMFGWLNLLIAAGNILPLYQHDGWKCGVVLMRAWLQRKSQAVEWAFTFSGGFASLALAWLVIRLFV